MFPAQRISLIKKLLIEKKSVDIATLRSSLDVSDVTVRKYLDMLEQEGFLVKVHGGAILADNIDAQVIDKHDLSDEIYNMEAKIQVAEIADTLVADGDKIYIGSGSTCFEFSKMLYRHKRIICVTNNVSCISELAPYVSRLFFVGGDVFYYNGVLCTQGNSVLAQMDRLYVSKAFLSVDGLDLNAGVTMNNANEAAIIKRVSEASTQTIILADSSKYDMFGLHRICPLSDFGTYISDAGVPEKYTEYFSKNGIKLLTPNI